MKRVKRRFNPAGFRVERIDSKTATPPLIEFHYLHRRPVIQHAFGLLSDTSALCGVITYGLSASPTVGRSACPSSPLSVIEFNRMWIDDSVGANAGSWFISRTLRDMPPLIIVSYADTRQGHFGHVYRAANFKFGGLTKPFRKRVVQGKHPRTTTNITSGRTLRRNQGIWVWFSVKARYWITTGSKLERRRLRKIVA